MKRILIALLAIFALQGAAAQVPGNRSWRQASMSARNDIAYWTRELGLTPKQRQQVEKLNRQYADLFHGPSGIGPSSSRPQPPHEKSWRVEGKAPAPAPPHKVDKGKADKELEKRWKEYRKGMKKILTGKQYKAYEKLVGQHGGK